MGEKFNISNLNLYYGDFHALKDVDLSINEKEITAFIGPSGCGKSTFLKCLNRMNDLVQGCKITGQVLLDGEDIYSGMDVNLLRKRVGMVFQKPNPFPMSIYDKIPARCGDLGRGQRPAVNECARNVRWTAAAYVHRACAGGRSGSDSDG